MSNWTEVGVGDVIKGARDGKAWEVIEKGHGAEVVIEREGRRYKFAPSGEVEILATAEEMVGAATASVKIILPGAVTVSVRDEDKVWTCPRSYPDVGTLQAHAFILHGKKLTEADKLSMMAEHAGLHEQGGVQHPHVHDRNFWKEHA